MSFCYTFDPQLLMIHEPRFLFSLKMSWNKKWLENESIRFADIVGICIRFYERNRDIFLRFSLFGISNLNANRTFFAFDWVDIVNFVRLIRWCNRNVAYNVDTTGQLFVINRFSYCFFLRFHFWTEDKMRHQTSQHTTDFQSETRCFMIFIRKFYFTIEHLVGMNFWVLLYRLRRNR